MGAKPVAGSCSGLKETCEKAEKLMQTDFFSRLVELCRYFE